MKKSVLKKNKQFTLKFLLVFLAVFSYFAIDTTIAFLSTSTNKIENTFIPVEIGSEIQESFDGTVKKDVYITNSGSVDVYVRVALIASWQKLDSQTGEIYVYSGFPPVLDVDYSLDQTSATNWVKGNDTFWYYKIKLSDGSSTSNLIDECKLKEGIQPPEGYHLSIEIISNVIQASPVEVVENAWNVTIDDNGVLTPN